MANDQRRLDLGEESRKFEQHSKDTGKHEEKSQDLEEDTENSYTKPSFVTVRIWLRDLHYHNVQWLYG